MRLFEIRVAVEVEDGWEFADRHDEVVYSDVGCVEDGGGTTPDLSPNEMTQE